MKFKILTIIIAFFILVSCQKKEIEPVVTEQEVSFSAALIQPDLKNSEDFLPCKTETATHAHAVINGVSYDLQVFTIGNNLYTQAIKLAPGIKTLTEFFLFADDGDGVWEEGIDIVVYATPADGSAYEVYLNPDWDLPYIFEVLAFQKIEINIEVLCFVDLLYQNFGFFWFQITQIIIREQCFFGDICINPDDYEGSLYEGQANGLQIDVPAIFFVEVFVDSDGAGPGLPKEVPYSPFGNVTWLGEGQPLCVQYPDNLSIDGEIIIIDLYVYIRTAPGVFQYVLYDTWTIEEDEMIVPPAPDGDGIIDFFIGDCYYTPPDTSYNPDDHEPPIEPTCETAFAYGGEDKATCFLDIPDVKNNRWGWTNGKLSGGGTYTFPIYAGAAQCDLDNGVNVGTLTIQYTGGSATVTYNIPDPDLAMYTIHIYVGNAILPTKNGSWTVTPGQYPWVETIPDGTNTYSHTFTGLSGFIYVVAHADVCGVFD